MYLQHLIAQKFITRTRRCFDRCLQSLPITQHERIWKLYMPFARDCGVQLTGVRVFRRYLQIEPTSREEYIEYLEQHSLWGEAAVQLAAVVNDPKFSSTKGRSSHALWMQLCDIVSQHPGSIGSLNVEAILRSGLERFTDEVGRLWCALSNYFIRLGHFERARDVYEEGIQSVITVRDFSMIFDAYVQFEEALLEAKAELLEGEGGLPSSPPPTPEQQDIPPPPASTAAAAATLASLGASSDDMDLRLRRLELLADRRPLLLSSVLLRQSPNNVNEWHKRAKLFQQQNKPRQAIMTFTEAVKTVDVYKAVGKPHTLWLAFAKMYEDAGDSENAAVVFQRAVQARSRTTSDLAALYVAWAELHMRSEQYERAREVMQAAVKSPVQGGGDGRPTAAGKLHRHITVWMLFLDLEENLGSVESVKAAYERCIELKVATPQVVMNYAAHLEENKYFEDSFRAFEKGLAVFKFPHAAELWVAYIDSFVRRFGGSKLERLRELCEAAVLEAPPTAAKALYLLYASLEEKHGLLRRALKIYQRAAAAVAPADRYEVYLQYIARTTEALGLIATRPVFEEAVAQLPESHVKDMCLRFASMEKSLGEVDRARAILGHAAQFANPKSDSRFWGIWHDFEVQHGNTDTYKDMRRIQRGVELSFSTTNVNAEGASAATETQLTDAALANAQLEHVTDAMGDVHPDAVQDIAAYGGAQKRQREAAPTAGAAASSDPMQALEQQAARIAAATGSALPDAQSSAKQARVQ